MRDFAEKTLHSTTIDAGNMAKMANAKKLIIGHFTARYNNVNTFLEETKTVFENTELATEGRTFSVPQTK